MIRDIIEIEGRKLGTLDFQTYGDIVANIDGYYFKGKNIIGLLIEKSRKELER
jgi:hypothetical protein